MKTHGKIRNLLHLYWSRQMARDEWIDHLEQDLIELVNAEKKELEAQHFKDICDLSEKLSSVIGETNKILFKFRSSRTPNQ